MTDPNRLWAKSRRDDEPTQLAMLLPGHLADVYAAATRVLHATGDDQLDALGLERSRYRDRLRRCVLLAASVHDLGKANDHFQGMVRGTRDVRQNPQGLRHEWVTVLMLKALKPWLLAAVGGQEIDLAVAEWAVAGHHPAHNHDSPPKSCPPGAGTSVRLLLGHSDYRASLEWLRESFSLAPPPAMQSAERHLVGADSVFVDLSKWERAARRIWDEKLRSTADARLVAAVKSCLIAADVAGSVLPKALPHDPARWDWIVRSFAGKPDPGDLQRVAEVRLPR
jgi:CRISPR-associated endonuclease/helicase Cas3